MNLPVLTYSGKVVFRPDTTRQWKDVDYYLPDEVNSLYFSPVVTIGVTRSGKCIAERFASRYFGSIGFGLLLFPGDFLDGSAEGYASACCLDHTSYLPPPSYPPSAIACGENLEIEILMSGKMDRKTYATRQDIATMAMCGVTGKALVRIGDIVSAELASPAPLMERKDGNVRITGKFAGEKLFDFNIIVE